MQTVAVIDYGMGNLHSVAKALEHVGAGRVLITSDAQVIREADRVVFPGVGAIRDCMAEIRRLGFDELVREVSVDRPFLGICVGMQALMERSEENGGVDCIGLFPGQVRFFGKDLEEDGERLKVPHMGWNEMEQASAIRSGTTFPADGRFYFVHSYYIEAGNPRQVVGGVAITARISPPRWPMVRALPCSSIPKRAIPTACSCCRTSPPGMAAGNEPGEAQGAGLDTGFSSGAGVHSRSSSAFWKTASSWSWARSRRRKCSICSPVRLLRCITTRRFSTCRRT
jgi:imidazole glycerol-phosphate synthase subunit HisH